MSIRQERRIITETGGAARRPYQSSIGAGLDLFEMAIGPGDAQRGDEMGLALVGRGRAALLQQPLDPAHRRHALTPLTPLVSRRRPAADVDGQDRGSVLIEDHPIAANAEAVAVAALKGPHVALARHCVPVKCSLHLLASVLGKRIDIFRRAQREDDRFHER